MSEKWLPVVGHEGWYDVSDHGNVMRMKAARSTFAGKILKPHPDSWGYPQVGLYKNGDITIAQVHRIVIAAFIGPCPVGKEVNHKDGDKTNNCLDNLEYVTPKENMNHAADTGLLVKARGEKHGNSKLKENNVHKIRKLLITESKSSIAKRFGVGYSAIYKIEKGITWSHLKEEEE